MRKYTLLDTATGEEIEAESVTAERVTGVENSYIELVLEQGGKFENQDWIVTAKGDCQDDVTKSE